MKTKILKIKTDKIDKEKIKEAGRAIREGKLVAFPTETVYGLGADALNDKAVMKIFEAKNRPFNDPLIVHIDRLDGLTYLVEDIPSIARRLGETFWPGPLTMVFKKRRVVSDVITAGLETVAVRMPDHPVARGLILESERPIVAPSANLFSRTSPTNAKHVFEDLEGKVDIIIDSGKTRVGVESTVVDVTGPDLKVLRMGGITVEQLQEITAKVVIANQQQEIKNSPGMLKKHYSPRARLILMEGDQQKIIQRIREAAYRYQDMGYKIGIITTKEYSKHYPEFMVSILGDADDLNTCAQNLFAQLRFLDQMKCDIIISGSFEERGMGRAIMDRLRRASSD